MPSDRQIAANRNNAKKSTGPRSEAGRKASRRNARRHGLAIAIRTDPAFHDDIEKLAKALSLSCGMQNVDERALEAAGAELDLLRIRKIRACLLETLSLAANDATSSNLAEVSDKLAKLERYERRAFSRRNRALREM
jgi:predicted DNA-binding ribbon-helix-helix protein